MAILSEKEIQYGFDHIENINVEKIVVELSEYKGESEAVIQCTQLDDDKYKVKDKKRILNEWIEFLTNNPNAFTKLVFSTRMTQELFDAVCNQKNLKWLYIKWGVYPDISRIADLKNLSYLHLGSGRSIQSIEPISKLKNLVALSIENFQNIDDFSSFSKLDKLESLSIEGDFAAPKILNAKDLEFLRDMEQLRYFKFLTARAKSKDYTPILSLKNLEHLSIAGLKEVVKIYDDLIKLPKLKYGFAVESPEMFKK